MTSIPRAALALAAMAPLFACGERAGKTAGASTTSPVPDAPADAGPLGTESPNLAVSIAAGKGAVQIDGSSGGTATTTMCSDECEFQLDEASNADLSAVPDEGWVLDSWDGACSGWHQCLVQVSGHPAVKARFRPAPPPAKVIRYNALGLSQLAGPGTPTLAEVLGDTGAVAGTICGALPFCYALGRDVFLWDGTLHRFPVDAGTIATVDATAAGRVAGTLLRADGAQRAFTSADSDLVELPTLGGDSFARAMNSSGVVVGASLTQSGEKHAVAWKDGGLIDLAARTGMAESVAMAIDESGRIAVLACHQAAWPPGCRAMILADSGMLDLGAIPDDAFPLAMSAQGSVVGFNRDGHAFVWMDGKLTDIDREVSAFPWPSLTLPAGSQLDSSFWGISPSGDVVGEVDFPIHERPPTTPILWKDGTPFDLAAGVEPPMKLHTAIAINAKGQILARTGLEEWTGVLLTPR